MAQTVNITGTVTDATGAKGNFSVAVTLTSTSAPLSVSATVTPASAAAGTSRNLKVTPAGGTTPYTFATPTSTAGLVFTPVAGLLGQWTFVY